MYSVVLVTYDYFLTFDSEVSYFWGPRLVNGASILLLLNRYLTLVVQILEWFPSYASLKVSCLMGWSLPKWR